MAHFTKAICEHHSQADCKGLQHHESQDSHLQIGHKFASTTDLLCAQARAALCLLFWFGRMKLKRTRGNDLMLQICWYRLQGHDWRYSALIWDKFEAQLSASGDLSSLSTFALTVNVLCAKWRSKKLIYQHPLTSLFHLQVSQEINKKRVLQYRGRSVWIWGKDPNEHAAHVTRGFWDVHHSKNKLIWVFWAETDRIISTW